MISKILIQTCKDTIPQYVQDMIIKKLPDEWEYFTFNNEQQRQYLKDNAIEFPNIVQKHDDLTGAHKSDLFRYYYLYKNGGVYLDDDSMFYNLNLNDLIYNYDCFFVESNYNPQPEIQNAFFGVPAGHIVIKTALLDLYKVNVNKLASFYEDSQKYLRNVYMLHKIVSKYNDKYNFKIFTENKNHNNDVPHIIENNKIIWKHYYLTKVIPNEI